MNTLQKAWERSRNIIRKAQGHDHLAIGAIRLAQQMPRIGFATTGDVRGVDIHSGYHNGIFIE